MNLNTKVKNQIIKTISECMKIGERNIYLEKPPENIDADIAFPCFFLAKTRGKNPVEVAKDIAFKIEPEGYIKKVEASGPYVNFLFDWTVLGNELLRTVLKQKEKYGSSALGKGKTVVIDYSSPNIAKPLTVGHLRSTIIGHSLYRIFKFLGYRVIGDNHLGDWGTQFGKLIYAYKKWGSEEKLRTMPIQHLLELYVRFHKEAETNPEIEEFGRMEFKKLEEGDRENLKLWKKFKEFSIKEFNKIYTRLGVEFDYMLGESEYLDGSKRIISRALKLGVAKKSKGAVIIEFEDMPPLLIQKSDEATLYQTRDLATLEYRMRKFKPEKILYVVGSEQSLHFKQVFRAAEMLGIKHTGVHVNFGLMSLPEGKMSTRKGRVVFLEDLLDKAVDMAKKIIEEKNPCLKGKTRIAERVGIGAVKYNDLSRDRVKDIKFDWRNALCFEGNTGPYLQYTYVRASSILRKSGIKQFKSFDAGLLKSEREVSLLRKIFLFPEIVENSANDYKPHYIANYAYELASSFNDFYESVPVLKAEKDLKISRLALTECIKIVLRNALWLLGIEVMERM